MNYRRLHLIDQFPFLDELQTEILLSLPASVDDETRSLSILHLGYLKTLGTCSLKISEHFPTGLICLLDTANLGSIVRSELGIRHQHVSEALLADGSPLSEHPFSNSPYGLILLTLSIADICGSLESKNPKEGWVLNCTSKSTIPTRTGQDKFGELLAILHHQLEKEGVLVIADQLSSIGFSSVMLLVRLIESNGFVDVEVAYRKRELFIITAFKTRKLIDCHSKPACAEAHQCHPPSSLSPLASKMGKVTHTLSSTPSSTMSISIQSDSKNRVLKQGTEIESKVRQIVVSPSESKSTTSFPTLFDFYDSDKGWTQRGKRLTKIIFKQACPHADRMTFEQLKMLSSLVKTNHNVQFDPVTVTNEEEDEEEDQLWWFFQSLASTSFDTSLSGLSEEDFPDVYIDLANFFDISSHIRRFSIQALDYD